MSPANGGLVMDGAPAIMIQISQCESKLRQFNDDGSVVRGPTKDIGLFQIAPFWIPTAKKLGYDVFTERGNISFALWLYKQQGTSPWNSSKYCWNAPADG